MHENDNRYRDIKNKYNLTDEEIRAANYNKSSPFYDQFIRNKANAEHSERRRKST